MFKQIILTANLNCTVQRCKYFNDPFLTRDWRNPNFGERNFLKISRDLSFSLNTKSADSNATSQTKWHEGRDDTGKTGITKAQLLPLCTTFIHSFAMSYFRITLHRSAIGLPKRTHGILAALGLHRRSQTVFHPVHPQFAGMILKVKELVRVEEVDKPLTKAEMKDLRRPDPGFYIEKAASRSGEESADASTMKETPETYAALL